MKITVINREQNAEELEAWNAWTRFCDEAKVAPDVQRDAEWLAVRWARETGNLKPHAWFVEGLMPENHPNYGTWR